tara:strand:- start:14478 stop:14828 length:351 start_codon:yes stop_codon:yes gene_type:complete
MTLKVSEALCSDTAEIITVIRRSSGFVDGLFVTGETRRFKTLASVQQLIPKDLLTLKESERTKDLRKFISIKPIQTSDDKENSIADIVLYKGKQYKIISSGDWDTYGYTESIGARN